MAKGITWIIRPAKVPNDNPPEYYEKVLTATDINTFWHKFHATYPTRDLLPSNMFTEMFEELKGVK